uniref:Putative secreted protein n=1 Tax=Anopheles darlingi TaxID=43151 RepID=A0A2M4DI49_ANODA
MPALVCLHSKCIILALIARAKKVKWSCDDAVSPSGVNMKQLTQMMIESLIADRVRVQFECCLGHCDVFGCASDS